MTTTRERFSSVGTQDGLAFRIPQAVIDSIIVGARRDHVAVDNPIPRKPEVRGSIRLRSPNPIRPRDSIEEKGGSILTSVNIGSTLLPVTKTPPTKLPPQPPGCCAFRPAQQLEDLSALSDLCKALGDSTRLQMVRLLAVAQRPLCVCELESQFDLSQPTISHHLRILREAGAVSTSRRGTWVFYELNPQVLTQLQRLAKLLLPTRISANPANVAVMENNHE